MDAFAPIRSKKRITALAILVAVTVLLVIVSRRPTDKASSEPVEAKVSRPLGTTGTGPMNKNVSTLMDLSQQLKKVGQDEPIHISLAGVENNLRAASPHEALRILLEFLNSGADAPTGLQFKVGVGGNLLGAPTLRVWALDQLGRLDVAVAANYAARIYARHDSADEWAIALRDDWRQSAPAGRIEPVRARALELLTDEAWAKEPSIGFLEALDLTVATMAWEAVPQLERWLDSTQPTALRAGAWIVLDRLTMEAPADFLPRLAENRLWLSSQPALRAGLMARADLASTGEKRAVETYLQRPDIAAHEGRRFFELLPNVTATISHNLVTMPRAPSAIQAARLDQAALASVREWRMQPRFARWSADLLAADARLTDSVASAVRGGYLHP